MIAGINETNGIAGTAPGLSSEVGLRTAPNTSSISVANEGGFGDLFKGAVGQVSELEGKAHAAIEGLMSGSGVDVHQAMIAAEKASMAFDLALAVRNKAIQSYQSIMNMQF